MTIKEAIAKFSQQLNNLDNPLREARLLACYVLDIPLSKLIANENLPLLPEQELAFKKVIKRRSLGEPFAYITGEKEFMGISFYVNENVLIPRPDTETLVNHAVGNESEVLDICTGSGCIAISLAQFMKSSSFTAVDISKKALKVAKINAERAGLKNIEFIEKDVLNSPLKFKKKFTLAVSNPPYIESSALSSLMKDVKDYEPMIALDGGDDGLIFYRKIVNDAPLFLEEGGRLLFEIGSGQGNAVKKIMEKSFVDVKIIKDYSGNDRVVSGTFKKAPAHSHNGHRQRMKSRYQKSTLDDFQPHEVLEFLLFYAIPRQDVNEKAHFLIKTFGSLSAVLDASVEDLMKYGKISENTAILLNLMPNLSRIYSKDKWKEKTLVTNTFVAGSYVTDLFVGTNYEAFYVVCLNSANGIIRSEKICEGTINETPVYPRLVVECALKHKANKIILAHNHPSGSLKPSWSDIEITEKIFYALDNIDITLIDHFIVGGENFTSMKDSGYMNFKNKK